VEGQHVRHSALSVVVSGVANLQHPRRGADGVGVSGARVRPLSRPTRTGRARPAARALWVVRARAPPVTASTATGTGQCAAAATSLTPGQ
jgi:hypothetical protein